MLTGTDTPESAQILCGWPTGGARQTLAKSVSSLSANASAHGQSARFLVCVDREGGDDDARALLAGVAADTAGRVVGLDERRRFIEHLPAHIDRRVAEYSLIPSEGRRGPGYNRNFLLLAASGGYLVMTDDDVISNAKASRDAARRTTASPAQPTFTTEPFPVPMCFFPDRASALDSVDPIDVDIIERHRTLLGSSVAAHDGTVALTCAGTYGDSGLGRARTVLALTGDARRDSFAHGYESIRYSRELVRVPDTDLVGPSMSFMAGQSGYDARDILPPFFPFVGNEDGFFAMLVRACRKESLTAYPAFALLHEPPSPRAFAGDSLTDAAPTVTDLMMSSLLLCMEGVLPDDPRARMTAIGRGYVELASLGSVDFVEAVHDAWSRGAMAYARQLESLLDRYDREPASWASDVDVTLDHVRELLREPAILFGPEGTARSIAAMRDHMSSFGRVLEQWPEVFDFARERREFFTQ